MNPKTGVSRLLVNARYHYHTRHILSSATENHLLRGRRQFAGANWFEQSNYFIQKCLITTNYKDGFKKTSCHKNVSIYIFNFKISQNLLYLKLRN